MSKEKFFIDLNNLEHGSTVPLLLLSMNYRTSGAKYSGVVAGTDLTFEKMKADPKSITFKDLITCPS